MKFLHFIDGVNYSLDFLESTIQCNIGLVYRVTDKRLRALEFHFTDNVASSKYSLEHDTHTNKNLMVRMKF